MSYAWTDAAAHDVASTFLKFNGGKIFGDKSISNNTGRKWC